MDFEKTVDFKQGQIIGFGGRLNLVPSFLVIDLIRKMRADFGPRVWNFYYNYVKASAMKHAFTLLESPGVTKWLSENDLTPKQVFSHVVKLIQGYGFGLIDVEKDELPEGYAFVSLENSSIALAFKEFRGESTKPVCIYVSGFLAGLASAVYGEEIDCIEEKCLVTGEEKCVFKLFPSSKRFENVFLEESGMTAMSERV